MVEHDPRGGGDRRRIRPGGGPGLGASQGDGRGARSRDPRDGPPGDPRAHRLAVDARAPRRYHPFLYPFHVDSLEDVTLVAVPRTWTIRSGIHRGETVETSLDPAVDDDASRLLYTYFYGQPHPRGEATTYRLDLSAWPHEGLPARVAFDRRHGSADITPGDSAGIWGVLDRMEEVFGLDLFQPATADPDWWPDPLSSDEPGFVPGVIRVVHDPPAWGGLPLGEGDPPTREDDLGAWAPGGRFTDFRVSRRTLSGGVLLVGDLEPLRLADEPDEDHRAVARAYLRLEEEGLAEIRRTLARGGGYAPSLRGPAPDLRGPG